MSLSNGLVGYPEIIMKILTISPLISPQKLDAFSVARVLAVSLMFALTSQAALGQDTIAPPSLGQDTKGTPAYDEKSPLPVTRAEAEAAAQQESEAEVEQDILGTASITESRRENGQVYEVEIDHSLGGKQYFEENDSDGSLETTPADLEDTPNLPKWKLGTW